MLVVKFTTHWLMEDPDSTEKNMLTALVVNMCTPVFRVSGVETFWAKPTFQVNSTDFRVDIRPVIQVDDIDLKKIYNLMADLLEAFSDNPHLPKQFRTVGIEIRLGVGGIYEKFERPRITETV